MFTSLLEYQGPKISPDKEPGLRAKLIHCLLHRRQTPDMLGVQKLAQKARHRHATLTCQFATHTIINEQLAGFQPFCQSDGFRLPRINPLFKLRCQTPVRQFHHHQPSFPDRLLNPLFSRSMGQCIQLKSFTLFGTVTE